VCAGGEREPITCEYVGISGVNQVVCNAGIKSIELSASQTDGWRSMIAVRANTFLTLSQRSGRRSKLPHKDPEG